MGPPLIPNKIEKKQPWKASTSVDFVVRPGYDSMLCTKTGPNKNIKHQTLVFPDYLPSFSHDFPITSVPGHLAKAMPFVVGKFAFVPRGWKPGPAKKGGASPTANLDHLFDVVFLWQNHPDYPVFEMFILSINGKIIDIVVEMICKIM
jgi:hypothetical protein